MLSNFQDLFKSFDTVSQIPLEKLRQICLQNLYDYYDPKIEYF